MKQKVTEFRVFKAVVIFFAMTDDDAVSLDLEFLVDICFQHGELCGWTHIKSDAICHDDLASLFRIAQGAIVVKGGFERTGRLHVCEHSDKF